MTVQTTGTARGEVAAERAGSPETNTECRETRPTEIDQVIERFGARFGAGLPGLAAELSRRAVAPERERQGGAVSTHADPPIGAAIRPNTGCSILFRVSTPADLPIGGAGGPARPALVPAVQLAGQMRESGFVEPPWLLQYDGRFIQVPELFYRVAEQMDGTRTPEEIAARVTEATEWIVSAGHVRRIIETKFVPLGLVAAADGAAGASAAGRAPSPLAVNLRMKMFGPRFINPFTRVLQFLYAPPILIPVLAALVVAHGWLYFSHGVLGAIRAVLMTPGLLPLVLAILLLASVFHEFGHAAALRYGGGKVGGIGAGLYLVYPVLYTDVTDGYRLGRWARVRTDLGGIYFHLLFALGLIGLYWATGYEFLLAIVVLANLEAIRQFNPLVRLDGYWVLADLTGIPDFFSQMGPFLRSILPIPGLPGSKLAPLKTWVKVIFAGYIAVTVPMLALLFFLMVKGVPALATVTWQALLAQRMAFAGARGAGDIGTMAATIAQALLLALPLLATAYFLYRVIRAPARAVWALGKKAVSRRRAAVSRRRALAVLLVGIGIAALVAFLAAPELPLAGGGAMPAAGSAAEPDGVQHFTVASRNHVQGPVVYPQIPPVGGNHAPIWQNCGFYDTPVANENAVHSLEHGAVWITYRPDLPSAEVDSLRRLAHSRDHVLVSPFPGLPAPVVASAWGRQLQLASPDDPRLDQFVRAFRLGPQAPERGGPCTGGVGTPQ